MDFVFDDNMNNRQKKPSLTKKIELQLGGGVVEVL